MQERYETLLRHPLALAEKEHEYQFLTEKHLQAMWLEQKYFKPLNCDGQMIEVISPGIWNAEAGPDFRKAHLKINGLNLRGDIELHLADDGWEQHEHHLDDRYNDVVMHLSLWKSKTAKAKEKCLMTKNGKLLPKAYFEDCLTIPPARIVQLIDLDLYPYRKFVGSGRCAQALFKGLQVEKIKLLFKDAADFRLGKKRLYLQARSSEPPLQLCSGMAMALGYRNNAEAFLELFLWLHKLVHFSEEQLLAISMRICGFFHEEYQKKWSASTYYNHLKEVAANLNVEGSPRFKLTLSQVRPFNHPIRRLVFMAKLLSDKAANGLYARLINFWECSWPYFQKNWNKLMQEFQLLLPVYSDAYWNSHYLFESFKRAEFLTLIGEDFKKEFLVNTFLPLLHEIVVKRAHHQELDAFYDFYSSIPSSYTSKTKYLIHRFFGDTPKKAVLAKADIEQGAYQLHRDFCIHYEASCEGCPFVERYKESPSYTQ